MDFLDNEHNIIVPKSIRPIIDIKETSLGNKKGSKRQFRYNKLHIREYENHYSVHMDRYNPEENPMSHLIFDAPEYAFGLIMGTYVGKKYGNQVYNKLKENKNHYALECGIFSGVIIGLAGFLSSTHIMSIIKSKLK